jgi:hypothetical protein
MTMEIQPMELLGNGHQLKLTDFAVGIYLQVMRHHHGDILARRLNARSSPPSQRSNLPLSRLPDPSRSVTLMKSKLLKKKSYAINQLCEVVAGQHENDLSRPTKGQENPPNPYTREVDTKIRRDTPALLKRNSRTARAKRTAANLVPIQTAANMYSAMLQHLEA